MKRILLSTFGIWLFISCGPLQYKGTTLDNSKALDEIMENKSFKIESNWAEPQVTQAMSQIANSGLLPMGSSVSQIDISTNANYLIFEDGKVSASLPFFGERQFMGSNNNRSASIEFEGEPENFKIVKLKNNSQEINFSINDKNSRLEHYNVRVYLFTNLKSRIRITSSHRFSIAYAGTVKPLDLEK